MEQKPSRLAATLRIIRFGLPWVTYFGMLAILTHAVDAARLSGLALAGATALAIALIVQIAALAHDDLLFPGRYRTIGYIRYGVMQQLLLVLIAVTNHWNVIVPYCGTACLISLFYLADIYLFDGRLTHYNPGGHPWAGSPEDD